MGTLSDWRPSFDLTAVEKALVAGTHFRPFPSLGTVVKNGQGWKWHPVNEGGANRVSLAGPFGPTRTRHLGP